MIICWLWDAGSSHGVTDDGSRARDAAAKCLHAGDAEVARVEKAFLVPGTGMLTMVHNRTGMGWFAQRYRDGRITWQPLPVSQELAAS